MRILIEEHLYPRDLVEECLWKGVPCGPEEKISFEYVGYYYNHKINECVLFLPRVLLEADEDERVFVERNKAGEVTFEGYTPEEIFDPEAKDEHGNYRLKQVHRDFIREFAVWIYRAIDVYAKANLLKDEQRIVFRKTTPIMGHGKLRECHTLLDVILALLKFQKENYHFFMTALYERHRGQNKVNWRKTVAKTQMMLTQSGPIYTDLINRKREVVFDEELFVIFYSILSYIRKEYGFKPLENPGFEELPPVRFKSYLHSHGRVRLRQIKNNYFSDLALQLWELCYAFFEHNHKIRVAANTDEYVLVKNFNIVFEAIIDDLLGDRDVPEGLKDQRDGKRVDHIYKYRGLTDADDTEDKDIYYIGDSKYYKRRTKIGPEALYKQFTYARNVLQWNIDLFLDGQTDSPYRDEQTEGYRIIPNFFISARIDDDWKYDHDEINPANREKIDHISRHFENRLFDRDTLLVAHYDVNFLFIISRYARNNKSEKTAWAKKIREEFRKRIRKTLEEKFDFYAITPKATTDTNFFFKEHFRELLGRVYNAYGTRPNGYQYYSLALRKGDEYAEDNEFVRGIVESGFNIQQCSLGDKPEDLTALKVEKPIVTMAPPSNLLTRYYLEKHLEADILVGFCKSEAHREWMFNRVDNKKSCNLYNIRCGGKRDGVISAKDAASAKFLVLYTDATEGTNEFNVYRLMGGEKWSLNELKDANYPVSPNANPKDAYYCYRLDEEITFGELDIRPLLTSYRLEKQLLEGSPFIIKGAELLKYQK